MGATTNGLSTLCLLLSCGQSKVIPVGQASRGSSARCRGARKLLRFTCKQSENSGVRELPKEVIEQNPIPSFSEQRGQELQKKRNMLINEAIKLALSHLPLYCFLFTYKTNQLLLYEKDAFCLDTWHLVQSKCQNQGIKW